MSIWLLAHLGVLSSSGVGGEFSLREIREAGGGGLHKHPRSSGVPAPGGERSVAGDVLAAKGLVRLARRGSLV